MKYRVSSSLAAGAILALTACGGEQGTDTGTASAADASSSPQAQGFPELTEGKGAGTLSGTIGANSLSVDGVCARSPESFDFWTDGNDFASASDATGDGQYLTLSVMKMQDRFRTSLRYSKDGKTVYNGLVRYESFDGTTMRVKTPLGREQEILADFTITCE